MRNMSPRRSAGFFAPALAIVAADQATKWYVDLKLPLYSKYTLLEGYLDLVHIRNEGAAFGILSGGGSSAKFAFFALVSLAVMTALAVFYLKLKGKGLALRVGLIAIFAGAAGNLVDRVRLGSVVDFIDIHVGRYHWPAFNLADISISVGVGLVLLNMLMRE